MASRTHSLHGSISPRNLRALATAHNLGGGDREVRHDGDAEGARLRRVRRAATRRRQEGTPSQLSRRLDVAQAIPPPITAGEVVAVGGLGPTVPQQFGLAALVLPRD